MTDIDKLSKQLMDDVLAEYYATRDVASGVSLGELLDEYLGQYNDDVAEQIETSIYKELSGSFTKSIPSVVPTSVALSDMLYKNKEYVQSQVLDILKDSTKFGETASSVAEKIYDGYDSGDGVLDVVDKMPKYIQDFIDDPINNAEAFFEQMGDLAGKPYKTAVGDIGKALESLDEEAIAKAMGTLLEEKARYYADRIAKTEIQRAKELANAKDMMNDPDIVYVKWELSQRHTIFDICDYYARLDQGYGAGIYKVGTSPHIPLHPHCMCKMIPHYHKIKKKSIKNPSKKLMDKLSLNQQRQIAGSWDKLDDYYSGTPLIDVFNKARPKYPITSVADVLGDVVKAPIALETAKGWDDGIVSGTKNEASNRLFRHTDGDVPTFPDLSKEYVDGIASGLDDVLDNYNNNGYVEYIGRTKTAQASYIVPDKWQPTDAFSIGYLDDVYTSSRKYMDAQLARLIDRTSPLIERALVSDIAETPYDYARITLNHEAWHKIDNDNGLIDIFWSKLKEAGIIKGKLTDLSYQVSYYAEKGGVDELFAEMGALYTSGNSNLIPKELLDIFESTIEGIIK